MNTESRQATAEASVTLDARSVAVAVAICSFNRAGRLPGLIQVLRAQMCDAPFHILIVDNNSTDNTQSVLEELSRQEGPNLRYVREQQQGITYARNRAIEECLGYDYILVMDDDELPQPGWIQAAVHALRDDGADCAGGRVRVRFEPDQQPSWLGPDLLGFLAEVSYGEDAFWIRDRSTPVWTANIAYKANVFRSGLRFDHRFNRKGRGTGGGEDVRMFYALLEKGALIRYRPDMIVDHHVEEWRLHRGYFLKLHYVQGYRDGIYSDATYPHTLMGIAPFMIPHAMRHLGKTILMWLKRDPGVVRQAMNCTHAMGFIAGSFAKWRGKNA